jgi:hypothetical protein
MRATSSACSVAAMVEVDDIPKPLSDGSLVQTLQVLGSLWVLWPELRCLRSDSAAGWLDARPTEGHRR